MYDKVYERLFRNISPFHNKVLRYNYDLPLKDLSEIIGIMTDFIVLKYHTEIIYASPDRLEYDGRSSRECRKLSLNEFKEILADTNKLYQFANEHEWMKLGLFDEKLEWYMRVFVENDMNIGPFEPRVGNVELYTNDHLMERIASCLENIPVGHMLIEGAKKYIEEIYI